MATRSALIQHCACRSLGDLEATFWKKKQLVEKPVKVGLMRGSGLQCRPSPAMEAVISSGSRVRATNERALAESPVEESLNGAHTVPAAFRIASAPLNEYIGYGFVDEENFYRERFVVRFSEVGNRGTMSLEMLASLLQEAACNHVVKIGYGAFAGRSDRLITVTTRMHIEVDRYPAWQDLLEIDTWYCTERRNSVRRDWTVKDVKSGETIAFATSTWVIMNMDTKLIERIGDATRAEFAPWARDPPKWALSDDRIKKSSERIPKINRDAEFYKIGLYPTERDLDMNQHVNNIKYISWTIESLPLEFRETHVIRKITLEYRREVQKNDTLESRAKKELLNDGALLAGDAHEEHYIHVIRNQDGQEINKGRTIWTPVQN